jgi:hypothetical protein
MEESGMSNHILQKAIDNLRIEDVYPRHILAACMNDFEPKYHPNIDSLSLQTLHSVARSAVAEVDLKRQILRVFIEVGMRWVDEKIEDPEKQVMAVIEAEFVAEYEFKDKLGQESIDAFAMQNASYHVWPYWRELLSSQCQRLNLPRLILPARQLPNHRLHNEEALQDGSSEPETSGNKKKK